MSGGTLVLANPLTLDVGLQFTGGTITSGILNIYGSSRQAAIMNVNNTTLNNFGSYDLVINSGRPALPRGPKVLTKPQSVREN